jgi:LytS/YehU family sensor histidine kinase
MQNFLKSSDLSSAWQNRILWASSELMHNAKIHGSDPLKKEASIEISISEESGLWHIEVTDEGRADTKAWDFDSESSASVKIPKVHLALSHGVAKMAHQWHISKNISGGHKVSLLLKIQKN